MARMGMALSIRAIRAIRGLISRMLARLPSCCGSAALGSRHPRNTAAVPGRKKINPTSDHLPSAGY